MASCSNPDEDGEEAVKLFCSLSLASIFLVFLCSFFSPPSLLSFRRGRNAYSERAHGAW